MHKILPPLAIIITLIILTSCTTVNLAQSRKVRKHYTTEEIEVLQKVHDFVFDQICPNAETNLDYKMGYLEYLTFAKDSLSNQASQNKTSISIPKLEKSAHEFIASLNPNEVGLIWNYTQEFSIRESSNKNSPVDTLQTIVFDTNSSFHQLIIDKTSQSKLTQLTLSKKKNAPYIYKRELKSDNSTLRNWKLFIQAANYPQYFDLKDPEIRILISAVYICIHYESEAYKMIEK